MIINDVKFLLLKWVLVINVGVYLFDGERFFYVLSLKKYFIEKFYFFVKNREFIVGMLNGVFIIDIKNLNF